MDTDTLQPFAGGIFRFWLPLPQIFAIERGPHAHKHEGYPRSIFKIYDGIRSCLGMTEEGLVYLGGADALVSDVRNVILQGLIGGGAGEIDGEEIKVTPTSATDLLRDFVYPSDSIMQAMHLAYLILDAAIHGVDLKKKVEQGKAKSPRSAKANSSPTAGS